MHAINMVVRGKKLEAKITQPFEYITSTSISLAYKLRRVLMTPIWWGMRALMSTMITTAPSSYNKTRCPSCTTR